MVIECGLIRVKGQSDFDLVGVAQISAHFGCFGKQGIEETGRVLRVRTIFKRDDYAVSHPQGFDDAGDSCTLFHLWIMAFFKKEISSPSDTREPNPGNTRPLILQSRRSPSSQLEKGILDV